MGKKLHFIAYQDDDDKVKEKYAFVEEDEFWISIQLYDMKLGRVYGTPFKIPKTRVLKLKEVPC